MRKKTVVVTALALALASSSTFARDREVAVSGACTHSVTPDRGAITVTAEFTDKDLKQATRNATEAYERALTAIKRLNLDSVDLKTAEYSVQEQREWEKNQSVFKGYRARMGVRVSTSSINRIGEIIAIASREGLKDVGQLSTFLSEDKTMRERLACLQEAAENARTKAQKLAETLKARIGDVVSITEDASSLSTPRPMMAMEGVRSFKSNADHMTPPPVEAGTQDLNVSVQVVFALK